MEIFERITVDPNKMGGVPCIRGLRMPVRQLLTLLADGMAREEILAEWDFLEPQDITACLRFAAHLADERTVATTP